MSKKYKLLILIPLFLLFIFLVKISLSIYFFGEKAYPKPSDVIVILGCGLYGSEISPFLKARLDHGLKLYREGYSHKIIVSGGKGNDEDISEAKAMHNYLTSQGVSSSNIIAEDQSINTKENLLFSKRIMDKNQWKTALFISNKFHLRRVASFAKDLNIKASYSGIFVSDHRIDEILKFSREVLASFRYLLF